ncbi:MAG: hypothetical protein Kow0068_11060 [Marinilabiliales bacterium]
MKLRDIFIVVITLALSFQGMSQNNRAQYPGALQNAYFQVNIGWINYPFDNTTLYPGYEAEKILVPHTAVRIIPYGYNINDYLAVHISYMRPVLWVRYKNVNGDNGNHAVFMNVGGLTVKAQYPVYNKFWIFGEAGLGVITRTGFHSSTYPYPRIMDDANYATFLFSGGIKYKINKKWALLFTTAYSPQAGKYHQPYTLFFGGGFEYDMYKLPENVVDKNKKSKYIFPENLVQLGYTTNYFGYGVNNFVSEGKIPVFWGGMAEIKEGFSVHFQRNFFHTYKNFAFDWGLSFSYWNSSVENTKFITISTFPVFRFILIRTKPVDFYINYSLAGPSYISGLNIDGFDTGPQFTFQDFMGIGWYFGNKRNYNIEIRIAHYSNGNLFPQNEGVKIPLTFNAGYCF